MNNTFKPYVTPVVLQNHLHLGGKNAKGDSLAVNSLYLERQGRPWIGIMGEFHYFRYAREDWKKELLKMKAGGIELVATYVPWLCHEEEEGVFDFEGQNDLRAFVTLIGELGMEAVIRIGPWVHGELRNGGFPDWLLKKPFSLRNGNPEFKWKAGTGSWQNILMASTLRTAAPFWRSSWKMRCPMTRNIWKS